MKWCYIKIYIMLAKKSATSKVDFREGITFPLKPNIGRSEVSYCCKKSVHHHMCTEVYHLHSYVEKQP